MNQYEASYTVILGLSIRRIHPNNISKSVVYQS